MAPAKLAILTSGGDAAGMNAAIRAATRSAIAQGWTVLGIRCGYTGLLNNDMIELGPRDVDGILDKGGTMLGSARLPNFEDETIQKKAAQNLQIMGVEYLIVIGGNGSQQGAKALARQGVKVVGIASTIDNDLSVSETCLGVDTALNVALHAADMLRVTASSHHRASILEVMGRNSGYIGLMVGIASGAEAVLLPEIPTSAESICEQIRQAHNRGKSHALIVVAEGSKIRAFDLERAMTQQGPQLGFAVRTTVLGHIQRGGRPTVRDRILGTHWGVEAVRCLAKEQHGILLGVEKGEIAHYSLEGLHDQGKPLSPELLKLLPMLAQ